MTRMVILANKFTEKKGYAYCSILKQAQHPTKEKFLYHLKQVSEVFNQNKHYRNENKMKNAA